VEEEEESNKSNSRTQDFLMPGLRHAHTLQQLKSIDEYSPPGEYLIKTNFILKTNKENKELMT